MDSVFFTKQEFRNTSGTKNGLRCSCRYGGAVSVDISGSSSVLFVPRRQRSCSASGNDNCDILELELDAVFFVHWDAGFHNKKAFQ